MLIQGDARFLPIRSGTIQCVVTSPPYWSHRDYGLIPLAWGGWKKCRHEWRWTHCLHCHAWWGSLGLEITPDLYVSHLVEIFQEVRRVLRNDGTLWLNLGDSYASGGRGSSNHHRETIGVKTALSQGLGQKRAPPGLKSKDLVGIPWRVALALQADGWYLRSDIIWAKPNSMPEFVRDRPTRSHEYMFLFAKSERYYCNMKAIAEPSVGSPIGRNRRTVWTIPTQPYVSEHIAAFPKRLVEPCLLAGSREGETILDPFAGSGTVGVVAKALGRRFVGVDLKFDYVRLTKNRVAGYLDFA